MIEKIDHELENNKEEKIKDLIKDILSLKRQKEKEGNNESEEIKLARRLEQRSNEKLSEEILDNIISRYEIDHNKLPTKKIFIRLMINYLGNIQKSAENYNFLNISKDKIELKNKIGNGLNGEIYAIKPKDIKTKKEVKFFAFKKYNNKKIPFPLDIHISSAILLALYDFQPKYYNQYFMEINEYKNKNIQRVFKDPNHEYKTKISENEISWYILYNFTNIRDQVNNMMQRKINNDYVKIDIDAFNSEFAAHKIGVYLEYFNRFKDYFLKYKIKVIKELNKLLIIKPEFIIDLIKFRTERGGFQVSNDILANHIDYLSSSYNVIKINKKEGEGFLEKVVKKCKKINNEDFVFWANPAFSWMLFRLLENNILTKNEYDTYINKFIKKSKFFKEISNKISGENNIIIFENININKEKVEEEKKEEIVEEEKIEEKNEEIVKEEKVEEEKIEEIEEEKIEEIEEEKIEEKVEEQIINKDEDKNNDIEIVKFIDNKENEKKDIENTRKELILSFKKRKNKQKIFCWFCCGKDSVEVL